MFQRGVWVCVSFAISVTAASAQPALDKASFSASPKELLAVATAVPASDHGAVILREEEDTAFEADGRRRYRLRRVFVVRTQTGVDDWGTFGASWSPFYQERPIIRARVIDPAGTVSELDPKLVTDAPTHRTSATVFSDQRRLDAPLPRLRIGSVVEEELTRVDRVPILAGAGMALATVGDDVPVQSTRLVFSAPAHKGRFHALALPGNAKPKRTTQGGRETWTLDFGPLAAQDGGEPHLPRDTLGRGLAGISMTSWSSIARAYKALVDKRIADGPLAYPDKLPRTPTIDTVRALTAWLHANIRYTGIEFDEASNIPWTPAETAKRGFGDCKDKATLLVALLRQAGIRAEIALLSTGPGFDVVPELPGMNLFDHAIVRARIGAQDIWIDATEDLVPPGALPGRDQMRRALIIADDTTALVDTPGAVPSDNTIRETRTFELAEQGAATRVTEVSVEGGVFAAPQRDWIRSTTAADVQKSLAQYVDNEYHGKLVRFTSTSPDDLTKPFTVTVEAKDSDRGWTDRDKIDMYVFASDTFERLPAAITKPDPARARRHDFVWPTPHVYEIENRIVIPAGFSMPVPAAERVRTLGTAKLTERQRVDGTTFVVAFRFETGKARLTPAELATLQKEIEAARGSTHIAIEHTGTALVERGKWKEGIAEIERLIAKHPKEALHLAQLATAYIRIGMGTAARRTMKKALELEPANADAHGMLAWVLKHDSLGRELGHDHDRAGALAALRKARKLDPAHVGAAVDLAELLARDTTGGLYGPTADLAGAAEAWRAAIALDDTDDNTFGLARVLLVSGKAAEAEAVVRKRGASTVRDGLLVAAVAQASGAQAAIETAGRLRAGTGRNEILQGAVFALLVARDYDRVRPLVTELGLLAPGTPQERLFRAVKRHDKPAYPPQDPRAPIADVFGMLVSPSYVPRLTWDAQTIEEQTQPINDAALAALRAISAAFLLDALLSVTTATVEGTGPWRVELDILGQPARYYAALDKGVAKLFATSDNPAGIGRHLFRMLAANQDAKASQVVGWLAKDAPGAPIAGLWQPAIPTDRATLELIAALLAVDTARESVPVLQRCATTVAEIREQCDGALAKTFGAAGKWKELEQHTAAWLKRKPDSSHARRFRVAALERLGAFDEADKLVTSLQSTDPTLALAYPSIAVSRGSFDEAFRRYAPLVKAGDAGPLNDLAWLHLVAEKDLPRGLELATRAVGVDRKQASDTSLNTLSALEAELGLLRAARDDTWQAMVNRRREVPEPQDWYVIGRIAEQLGLREDAIAAYRKCPADSRRTSVYALAQRRLQRMGVK